MAIGATIRWDSKPMNRAISTVARLSKNSLADTLNNNAKFVAINIHREAKPAGAKKIRAELNAPSRVNPKISIAQALVWSRSASKQFPKKRAVSRFIGRKASSNTYLRAGMIPAFRAFGSRQSSGSKFNNPPGSAKKARAGIKPKAVIHHFDKGINEAYPNAFLNAIQKQTAHTERYAANLIRRDLRKAGF